MEKYSASKRAKLPTRIELILPQPKTVAYESVDIADRLDDLLAVKHEKRESHARWKRWKRSMRRERAMQGGWKNEKQRGIKSCKMALPTTKLLHFSPLN
jgi:hypothetical protein